MPSPPQAIAFKRTPCWECRCGYRENFCSRQVCRECGDAVPKRFAAKNHRAKSPAPSKGGKGGDAAERGRAKGKSPARARGRTPTPKKGQAPKGGKKAAEEDGEGDNPQLVSYAALLESCQLTNRDPGLIAKLQELVDKEKELARAAKSPHTLLRDIGAKVQRMETRLEKLTTTVEEKQKELLEAQEELAKHQVNLAAARADLLAAQERVVQTTTAQVASSKGPLAAISAAFGDIPEEVATSASCLALQGVLQQAAVLLAAVQAEAAAAREAAAKAATAAAENSGESTPEQQGARCDTSDQDMAEDPDITEEEVAQFLALDEHRDMAASFTTEEARKKLAVMLRGFKKVSRAKGSKGHPSKRDLVKK